MQQGDTFEVEGRFEFTPPWNALALLGRAFVVLFDTITADRHLDQDGVIVLKVVGIVELHFRLVGESDACVVNFLKRCGLNGRVR
jgi:hypothetical protein